MHLGKETPKTKGWKLLPDAFHFISVNENYKIKKIEGHCFLE
jgi:hypothetical protein